MKWGSGVSPDCYLPLSHALICARSSGRQSVAIFPRDSLGSDTLAFARRAGANRPLPAMELWTLLIM
jgi:hypothetical protein